MENSSKRLIALMIMAFSVISTTSCIGLCFKQGMKIQDIHDNLVVNESSLYDQVKYDVDFADQKEEVKVKLKQSLDNKEISKIQYNSKMQDLKNLSYLIDEMIKQNCSSVTKHQEEIREINSIKQSKEAEQKIGFMALGGLIASTGTFAAAINIMPKKEEEEEQIKSL